MENFILLGAQEDSLFFLHIHGADYNRYPTYHLFYALEHCGIVKSKNTIVNIYEMGDKNEVELVSLQHESKGTVDQFDLDNIKTLFKAQCVCAEDINTLIIEYSHESGVYTMLKGSLKLPQLDTKEVANVEYISLKNYQPNENAQE